MEAAGLVNGGAGREEIEGDLGLDLVLGRAGPPPATERSRSVAIAAAALSAAALRNYLGRLLPAYMIPPDIVFLERFPLPPNQTAAPPPLPKPQPPSPPNPQPP